MALVREWRRDAAVRLLAILLLATLVLSLGPYVPGFRLLIRLPGFSFFRAPVALEPGDVAGAGVAGGEGIRPLAGVAAAGALAPAVQRRGAALGAGDAGPDRAGAVEHGEPGLAARSREAFSGCSTRCRGTGDPNVRRGDGRCAQARDRSPTSRRA